MKVTLEPLAAGHAGPLQELAAEVASLGTTRLPHPYPPDGAVAFIAEAEADRLAGRKHAFAVVRNARVVGCCGIFGLGPGETPEVGYWIGQPYRGSGLATASVEALLQFALGDLGLEFVTAKVLEGNAASLRVLAKCGFQITGRETHAHPGWDPSRQLVVHELRAAQWRLRPGRSAP